MHLRPEFSPGSAMIVNKPFRWAGTDYSEGMVFPVGPDLNRKQLRRVRQMYDARYLRHASKPPHAETVAREASS